LLLFVVIITRLIFTVVVGVLGRTTILVNVIIIVVVGIISCIILCPFIALDFAENILLLLLMLFKSAGVAAVLRCDRDATNIQWVSNHIQ
jgi:hypothetical protein